MLADPIPALKRELASAILAVADQTNMHVAAGVLGIDVARMSDLRRGRIDRFSVERLIRMLAQVDRRVDLKIVIAGRVEVRWFAVLYSRSDERLRVRPKGDASRPQNPALLPNLARGSPQEEQAAPDADEVWK